MTTEAASPAGIILQDSSSVAGVASGSPAGGADLPPVPSIDELAPHPTAEHIRTLRAMIEETLREAGPEAVANPAMLLPLGQRVLRKVIPYTETLARSGPHRRSIMIEALTAVRDRAGGEGQAEGEAKEPESRALRIAADAAITAVRLNMDSVLVDALQDTRSLAASAPAIARCLLALFNVLAGRG